MEHGVKDCREEKGRAEVMESGEMYMRGRAGNRTHRGSKGGERER